MRFRWGALIILGLGLAACIAPALAASDSESPPDQRVDSLSAVVGSLELQLKDLQRQVDALGAIANASDSAKLDESMLAGRGGAVYLPPKKSPTITSEPEAAAEPTASLLEESKLKVSGFMDGVYAINPRNSREDNAHLNQVEIDLARDFGERATVAVSVWYDQSFTVGAATISYALRKPPEENAPPASSFVSGWTATAGQFDVPFGLDYFVYTSIARPTVTMPFSVKETHGPWNDLGLLNTITTSVGTWDAYVVRGFESKLWLGEGMVTSDAAEDSASWGTSLPSATAGTRLSFTHIPGLEYGGSFARGFASTGRSALTLGGLHATAGWKSLSAKAEAIYCRKGETLRPELLRGGYLETMQRLGRVYFIQRFDYLQPQFTPLSHYYSAGGGVDVGSGIMCRAEYRWSARTDARDIFLQIAAGF
jgi:hypothetical protein